MTKVYEIIGLQINTLDELLTAIKDNYSEIYSYFSDVKLYNKRIKELVNFVKTNDKELGNVISNIVSTTTYLHNVLTFIVFYLSNKQDVYINGKKYSFIEFIEKLKLNDDIDLLKQFILNHGISKTYGEIVEDENFKENMIYVENNIDNSYVYNYLLSYYDYSNSNSVVISAVSQIAIRNEECFYCCENAFKDANFLLNLAHKVKKIGPVIDIIRSDAYVFKVVKLLYDDMDNALLIKLCTNSYYDWLLNHINEYKYKGKAKSLKSLLLSKLKEANKVISKCDVSNKVDFLKIIDFENELYDLYNRFVELYKDNKIIAKIDDFKLDKEYASTLICQNYIESVVLDLNHTEIHKDPNLDTTFDGIVHYDVDLTKKKRKIYKKLSRFGFFSILISIFLVFSSIIFLVIDSQFLSKISLPNNSLLVSLKNFGESFVFPNIFLDSEISIIFDFSDSTLILFVISLLLLIFSIVIKIKANKGFNNICDYVAYNYFKADKNGFSKDQRKVFKKLSKKNTKLELRLNKNYRITSCIVCVLYTLSVSLLLCCSLYPIFNIVDSSQLGISLNLSFSFINLVIGFVFSLLYGSIKKSKGFLSIIILNTIAIVSVIAGMFIVI